MAVVVGTDVYISVADADTYWLARGNAAWAAASDAAKEAALLEATQYLDGAYTYIGDQITTQVLAWPRYDAQVTQGNFKNIFYDSDTIPPQIETACAELALEGLDASLQPAEARGGAIKKEKVDVIEVEYMDWAPSGKTYGFVTNILKPLLINQNKHTRKVIRT